MRKKFFKKKLLLIEIISTATILFTLMLLSCTSPTANSSNANSSKSDEAVQFDLGSTSYAAFPNTYTNSDPSGKVFWTASAGYKMYVFTSSDLNQSGNWPMNQTRVYTSDMGSDYSKWTFSGGSVILEEKNIPWVTSGTNHLWAPDCQQKYDSGAKKTKYYLFFPDLTSNDVTKSRIGVAIGDSPTGPFTAQSNYMSGVGLSGENSYYASDPAVYRVDESNYYMIYCTGDWDNTSTKGKIAIVKLSSDLKSGVSNTNKVIDTKCTAVYLEGGYLIAKDNLLLLMYSAKWDDNHQQSLCWSWASYNSDPTSVTWTYGGYVLKGQQNVASTNWTNHGSIAQDLQGRYTLFYHEGDTARSGGGQNLRHSFFKQLSFGPRGGIIETIHP